MPKRPPEISHRVGVVRIGGIRVGLWALSAAAGLGSPSNEEGARQVIRTVCRLTSGEEKLCIRWAERSRLCRTTIVTSCILNLNCICCSLLHIKCDFARILLIVGPDRHSVGCTLGRSFFSMLPPPQTLMTLVEGCLTDC